MVSAVSGARASRSAALEETRSARRHEGTLARSAGERAQESEASWPKEGPLAGGAAKPTGEMRKRATDPRVHEAEEELQPWRQRMARLAAWHLVGAELSWTEVCEQFIEGALRGER